MAEREGRWTHGFGGALTRRYISSGPGEKRSTFFILSGFVLTLPLLRAAQPNWGAYYPKRIVRIYLPVWASIVFALLMAWALPRAASGGFSSWLNLHDEPPNVLSDVVLLGGAGQLNSPLWSLQWEMTFSLLLPLYWLS